MYSAFQREFKRVQLKVHKCALDHGFWEAHITKGDKIALMHSELSEVLEAVRKPSMRDSHLPHLHPEAVELADCIIRIMDYAQKHALDVAGAIIEKSNYNENRPHKHGKLL